MLTEPIWQREPDIEALRRAHALLKVNPENAAGELKALADRGSVMSIWYLGDAYYSGRYFQKNLNESKLWYGKGCDAQSRYCCHMVGRICFDLGDFDEAFTAFSIGERSGYLPSLYRIAMMYKDGQGCNVNLDKCREILSLATNNGHLFAQRELATLFLFCKFGIFQFPTGVMLLLGLLRRIAVITLRERNKISEFDERVLC